MFKINLIPEVKQEQIRIKKLNVLVTSIATGTGVVIAAAILILLSFIVAKNTQINKIEKETTKIEEELLAYKDLEQTVITLENGLNEIKRILGAGPKWSKFFTELEKVTPADTQITTLSMKANVMTLGVTGKDVKSIDRFVKSFSTFKVDDKNLFSSVKVNGYTENQGKINFNATMNLVNGVLW